MSKLEDIEKVFKEHVSYDCNGYSPEKKCPACGHTIEKESHWGYWIDHVSVLSGYLAEALSMPKRYQEDFEDWLKEQFVTGNETEDAKNICEAILKEWS